MITRLIFNCSPDGLADVTQEAFAEAFENEIRLDPKLRDCGVEVTFNLAHENRLAKLESDEDITAELFAEIQDFCGEASERAFKYCCENPD